MRPSRYCEGCGVAEGYLHHVGCVHYNESNLNIHYANAHPAAVNYPKDTKIKSDGGSTDYYKIPAGATDLIDLIEHKKMSFSLGNIFKACYRLGEKEGNDLLYDLNKIIFFAERMKAEVEKSR
jgi:hypothetical protein